MFLLRVSFENHRSFRDEKDLTFVYDRLKTSKPPEGETWADYTSSVAVIYGPNASGKSAVIDALKYIRHTIKTSGSTRRGSKQIFRQPFALNESSKKQPSSFALEFVIDDVRYEYGFTLTSKEFSEEWLYFYPEGRKIILFERGINGGTLKFGRALKGGVATLERLTGQKELILSRGAEANNEQLQKVYDAIVGGIVIADFNEANRQSRLRAVIEDLTEGKLKVDELILMLKVADVGIAGAEVEESEMPAHLKNVFRAIYTIPDEDDSDSRDHKMSNVSSNDEPDSREGPAARMTDEEIEALLSEAARNLMFRHLGEGGQTYSLGTGLQSTGTLTWLSLAAPAIKAIREGGVLCVDELDASLHPQLAQVMIQMFRDKEINGKNAQLVFTTHDTYFMSPASGINLAPEQIWFTEKNREGVSDLYSLSDFPVRKDENLSRRYLHGRYGAVPSVAPSFLRSLTSDGEEAQVSAVEMSEV
jgi:hypothetical protein